MSKALIHLMVACAVLSAGARVAASDHIQSRPIQFAKGASSATVKGTIKGDQTIDYKLRAKAGQTMSVKLVTQNDANYFNVLPPGSKDAAIFIGSTSGNEWTGVLPADGEYTVRVYLMRSAARRNESTPYTLTVGVTGAASTDAKVKGTPFNATGPLECSMGNAPAKCEFGVIRGKPGIAEVRIKPAGGFERVLTFTGNTVTSGSDKVKATKSGDTWTIQVNDYESYTVPEAVISGG